ncbi:MAG: cupin domain-containing protein [Actinobacteria bacterium]|nr:cupin domain-containing protein [Thermoleophilia bacterium]MCB9010934.1 cupin domain-containing protein [Actinomycetota bacterium]
MSEEAPYGKAAINDIELRERRGGGAGSRDIAGAVGATEMAARMWRFGPGDAMPLHRHGVQEELYTLLSGGPQTMQIGLEEIEVEDGDWICVPKDTPRRIMNQSDRDAAWLIVAAPVGSGITDGIRLDPETGEEIPRPS